jgi:hypothetical protein
MTTRRRFLASGSSTLAFAVTGGATFLPQLARAETTAASPGILAAKDIAEAAYIYGLPIVMN